MKALFLDINGVLNTVFDKTIRRSAVNLVNSITDRTGAQLVLTTFNRVGNDMEQVCRNWGLTGVIAGCTPVHVAKPQQLLRGVLKQVQQARQGEIKHWLETNPVERYVVIDDIVDVGMHQSRLVCVNAFNGLKDSDASKAIALFQ